MKGRIVVSVAILVAAAVSGADAVADGWRLALPQETIPNSVSQRYLSNALYVEPTYEHQWRSLGRFSLGATSLTYPTAPVSTRIDVDGSQAGMAAGLRLPEAWAPGQLRNLRVEFSGAWYRLAGKESNAFPLTASTFWFSVSGQQTIPAGTTGIGGYDFFARLNGFEAAVRVAGDVAVTPSLTLTPALGFFGGASRAEYRMVLLDGCSSGTAPCFQDTLQERINQRDIGGSLSLSARYALNSGLSLTLGGGVSVVHTHAKLNATDCFDATVLVDGCQAVSLFFVSSSASASLNRWGFRAFGSAGLGLDLDFVRIDLGGSVRYSSVVPQVRNPTGFGQAVSLGSAGQIAYAAQARFSFPLGIFR